MLRFRYMISEQAKQRVRVLAFWEKHGQEATQEAFNVSRRTLYRWQASLKQARGKLEGLNAHSTTPRSRRKRVVPDEVIAQIIALRTAHPRLGKEKLRPLLSAIGYTMSVSTVGRILGDLKQAHRLAHPAHLAMSARSGNLIEKKFIKRTKKLRRPQGYRVLEADTMVRFIDGMKRYILTGIDTEARTAFAGAYTNHGSKSATDFLLKTRAVLPMCPVDVQTDNGSEFALHFHAAVKETGLHFNTHPRSPKENAHVERFNRTLNEEFLVYHRELLRDDVAAFNQTLVDWLIWYNTERPHHALGNVAPLRYAMSTLPVDECQMLWTHTSV